MKSSHHASEAETSDNGHNWTKVQFPDEPCKINIVWSTVFKHRKAHLWCIDTGANVAVTSPTDLDAIVRILDEQETLLTSGGPVKAKIAILRTPIGELRGLLSEGSPRILPGHELSRHSMFLMEFERAYIRNSKGTMTQCIVIEGIPYLPAHVKNLHAIAERTNNISKTSVLVGKQNSGLSTIPENKSVNVQQSNIGEPAGSANLPVPESVKNSENGEQPSVKSSDADQIQESTRKRRLDKSSRSGEQEDDSLAKQQKQLFCHAFTHYPKDPNCPHCIAAKMPATGQYRAPDGDERKSKLIGEKCYADLCTNWPASKGSGERNFLGLIDECSGLIYVVPLLGKMSKAVHEALLRITRDLNGFREFVGGERPPLRVIKTDWGGEFIGLDVRDALVAENIILDHGVPYRHVSKAERLIKTVAQGVRTLLLASGLPAIYWVYAARTFAHNKRCENSEYRKFAKITGKPNKPRVFGQLVFVKLPRDGAGEHINKSEPAATACAFLCYENDKTTNGMYVTYMKNNKLHIALIDGRDMAGVHWPPVENGKVPMAFKTVYRNLNRLTVPEELPETEYDTTVDTGIVESNEITIDPNDLLPTLDGNPDIRRKKTQRDLTSCCPACRGRKRKHTREPGCRLYDASNRTDSSSGLSTVVVSHDHDAHKPDTPETCIAKTTLRGLVDSAEADSPLCDREDIEPHRGLVVSDGNVSQFEFSDSVDRAPTANVETNPLSNPTANNAESFASNILAELEQATLKHTGEEYTENVLNPDHFQHPSSFLTRKMTKEEVSSEEGQKAQEKEMRKMCVDYEAVAPPIESKTAEPGSTLSGFIMLTHVKNFEKAVKDWIYKGRAVVLGHKITKLIDNQISGQNSDNTIDDNDNKNHEQPSFIGGISDLVSLAEARLIDAWALINGYKVQSIDIENGYLQQPWNLPHKHYIKIPKDLWKYLPENLKPTGIREPIWEMKKCIYGHPKSGELFIEGVVKLLIANGYKPIGKTGSKALMTKGNLLVAIYVDDIKASGPDQELEALFSILNGRYPFKDGITDCDTFLGTTIVRDKFSYAYDMADYCHEIAKVYRSLYGEFRPARVPIADNLKTYDRSNPTIPESRNQKLIGMLLWLCRTSRPDIAFAVSALGSRLNFWDDKCSRELERLVGYIESTANAQLVSSLGDLEVGDWRSLSLSVYTDSDWAAPKSQSGFIIFLENKNLQYTKNEEGAYFPNHTTRIPLIWGSRKQAIIAESAAAAECTAAYTGIHEAIPLSGTINDAGRPLPVKLFVDNSQVISLAKSGDSERLHFHHKALNIRINMLQYLIENGFATIDHIRTAINPANLFTKVLGRLDTERESALCGLKFNFPSANLARANLWRRLRFQQSNLWRRCTRDSRQG